MSKITLHNKTFEPYIGASEIASAVHNTAQKINAAYQGKSVCFVVVLKGAFVFAADLLRFITVPCTVSFVRLSSYQQTTSTGSITLHQQLPEGLENKHVIIVEDIVDTGQTARWLSAELAKQKPASIKIASAFDKPVCRLVPLAVDYVGIILSEQFVVGYGLDYDELGRNLPDLYVLSANTTS